MKNVLTENQILLARYLTAIGCEKLAVILMVTRLTVSEDAVIEMLEFCRDNHPAPQAELLKMSSKISSKYRAED